MAKFEVERTSGKCATTGAVLEEGEEFYAVLFEAEDGASFHRVDYSFAGWPGQPPEGCYCHFKSRIPVKQKVKQLLIDNDSLITFFQRLESEQEPLRIQFRFVLALLLMRKRLLRYDDSTRADEGEVWQMTLTRDHSTHRVINPQLTDDQIAGVSQQLTAILHGDTVIELEEAEQAQADQEQAEHGEAAKPEPTPQAETAAEPTHDA